MKDSIPTVKLKNGAEEVRPLVAITMRHLEKLFEEGKGLVVYELVEICKDSNHKPWGKIGEDLARLDLAREVDGEWHVHNSIRNIVLSATEGGGLDLKLVSPVATPEPVTAETTP